MQIEILGEMPGMNEMIAAAKQGKKGYQPYANMKHEYTQLVAWTAKALPKMKRIKLDIIWYAKSKRHDPDNIAAAVKFIWDGLVLAGVIPNDGWAENAGWSNSFAVDKDNPRVVINIEEVEQCKEPIGG